MLNINLLIPLLLINYSVLSQVVNKSKKPVAGDCGKAIKIPFEKKAVYGPTVPPVGFGAIQEIKSKTGDKYFFEKEHNSAWYLFFIKSDGKIGLTITPINKNDDYDFLLFKYTDSCFCDDLAKKKIIPLRTNISRTGIGGTETTGLSNSEENSFFSAGKGRPFSKSLPVKKGEKYYLVLDNVYPNGDGHTVEIGYEKEVSISGIVLNEENKPVKAEVILEDQKGVEVKKTFSDSSGKYTLNTTVLVNTNYNVVYLQDSSFVKITEIKAENLVKNNYKLDDIKIVLPKLRKGAKYQMEAINFYGGSSVPLLSSHSSIKALYILMKKNPQMIIEIQGHTNDPLGKYYNDQELSRQRTNMIRDYLIKKGINKERIYCVGFGDKFMLFPDPKNFKEEEQNRRVEIKVISY